MNQRPIFPDLRLDHTRQHNGVNDTVIFFLLNSSTVVGPGAFKVAISIGGGGELDVMAPTAYAEQMVADEWAYLGYHAWQVYFTTELGDVLLPVGYEATERRPVTPADLS